MKLIKYIFFIISLSFLNTNYGDCARILGIFSFFGSSHFNLFEKVMKNLADNGHEVDVVSHFPLKEPYPRWNDISLAGTLPVFLNNLTMSKMRETTSKYMGMDFLYREAGTELCKILLSTPQMKQLLNTTVKYDLVITHLLNTDCFLGYAWKHKAPTVGIITSVVSPPFNDRFGNPDNPSYIPTYFSPFDYKMTLYQRTINSFYLLAYKFGYEVLAVNPANKILKEYFGEDCPDINYFIENMSLMLVNSHYSINQARPMSPAVIEVAGLHINNRTPKIVDKRLQKVVNESTNGIIVFSMGSMLRIDTFSPDKLKALYEAFSQLPYTIVWKGEEDKFPKPKPKNVVFFKWLPQFDLLCQPNTKLFISHGGSFGTQESIHCGVPILGIPLFSDQHFNIQSYINKGIALKIKYEEITKDNLMDKFNKMLGTSQYYNRAKELSKLFRDRPISALDNAIYWIEYVIKYGGAPFLKPYSTQLNWFQLHLIDVALVFIAIILATCVTIYYLLSFIYKKIISKVLSTHIKEKIQ